MPGWQCDISSIRDYSDLPKAARNYVERIEELVGVVKREFWLPSSYKDAVFIPNRSETQREEKSGEVGNQQLRQWRKRKERASTTNLQMIKLPSNRSRDISLNEFGATRSLDSAQKKGSTILNLKCVDAQTGLMGKTLLEFQSNKGDVLPPHKFGNHDVVVLKPNKSDLGSPPLGQGVVYRIKVTYRRMKETLIQLSKSVQKGPAADLVPVFWGEATNSFQEGYQVHSSSVVQGPLFAAWAARNRKTTTVVEIILQEVKRGTKILACAASNIAVDNIVERLVPHRVKLVRVGHPARLLPQVLESALDAQVLRGDNSALANDICKEMKALNGKLLKAKDKNTKREIRRELKTLSKEERKRQQLAVTDVIKNADVVLTTLTGALSKKLDGFSFDLVIIDEAAQALEIACWIALLKGPRCILAGDHLQLPPTIQSVEAEKKGLGRTLFERLTDLYGDDVTSMLTVQYRMHELIMNWSSEELYDGKKSPFKCCCHTLYELEDVKKSSSTEPTLLLIDIAGRLVESGVQAANVGIITPYAAQVVQLKMLKSKEDKLKDMEISTVDGFQGREKEAIIISMVRSTQRESDRRRMNVAVTRARRQCCIICDTETVSGDKFLERLIEYFEEHGEYLSASEYDLMFTSAAKIIAPRVISAPAISLNASQLKFFSAKLPNPSSSSLNDNDSISVKFLDSIS
ncbi:DNA-binding protein SMUBP-2 [Sesamum angolense]|uniref:DNA helicase n=1 Tax=Sesamum angolense TaxID=2727404 RepID=A0AAE1X425_9LAMI|nr:DNA-binding protein SMUBP-2 [Sesamum angolense]